MSSIKEICEKDNTLQRQVIHGNISRHEYNIRRIAIHTEYIKAINEKELLDKLINKHRPNNSMTKEQYDRIFR